MSNDGFSNTPLLDIAHHLGVLSSAVTNIQEDVAQLKGLDARIAALERTTLSLAEYGYVRSGLHTAQKREEAFAHIFKQIAAYLAVVAVMAGLTAIGLSQYVAHVSGH